MGSITDKQITGNILTHSGWINGNITWNDEGTLTSIEGNAIEQPTVAEQRFVAGFVDLHVHGGNGADAMEGENSVREMAMYHLLNGTTALAPTTMTGDIEDIKHALNGIETVRKDNKENEAIVIGAHLEGPFLNENCLGAQPPKAIAYDQDAVEAFINLCQIKVATIAVEIQGGYECLQHLTKAKCKVQVGHSDATAEQVKKAVDLGLTGYTHFYNAMPEYTHLEKPGIINYALAHANYAEVICDLIHVNETALKITHKCIPNMYAITDSTSAAGREDGKYQLGDNRIVKTGFVTRTLEGGLAGTATTMKEMRKNLLSIGFSEVQVQDMVSTRPAAYLDLNYGEIKEGKLANIVEISNNEVNNVWLKGKLIN